MEDKRLERLYDYTKFHIGIYLSAAAGLAALISTAAEGDPQKTYIASLIGAPWALVAAFGLMVLAGMAGGIVATSAIESESYNQFSTAKQGISWLKCPRLLGKTWASIEHASFWLSLGFLAYGVFSARTIARWLCS